MRLVGSVRIPRSCGLDVKKQIKQEGGLGGYAPATEVPIVEELDLAFGLYTYCFRDFLKRPYFGRERNMDSCRKRFEHWLNCGEDFMLGADIAAGRDCDLRKCEPITEEHHHMLLGTNLFTGCQ